VTSPLQKIVNCQRRSLTFPSFESSAIPSMHPQRDSVEFTFIRNFNKYGTDRFHLEVQWQSRKDTLKRNSKPQNITLSTYLPPLHSFIALGNYTTVNRLHLILAAVPIVFRKVITLPHEGTPLELWIIANEGPIAAEMAFEGHVECDGPLTTICK